MNDSKSNKLLTFIKGSAIIVLSNVCLKLINFFLLPLYTDNLTPQMLGISDSISSLTAFIYPVLVMGLDSAYSAFYFEKKEPDRGSRVYSTISILFIFIGMLPFLSFFFAEPLSKLLFGSEKYGLAIKIAMSSISFNLWFLPASLELRMENKLGLYGLSNILASLLLILLNILFVSILKYGEYSLIISSCLVNAAQLLILALMVRKVPKPGLFDKPLLHDMLKFALPMVPAMVMSWILNLSDKYVLLYYHGDASVGLYSIATRLVSVMSVITSAVFTAYSPFAYSSKEDEDAKSNFYYVFNVVALALLFVAFTASIFGKEIIHIMTADSYESAYLALRDRMYAQAVFGMSTVLGYGAFFAKQSKYSLYAVSAAAVTNLVLNFIFIPKYGIQAAAATTLIGTLVNTVIVYLAGQKFYPCDYGVRKILLTGLSIYAVSILMQEAGMAVKILSYIVCVAAVCFAFRKMLNTIIKVTVEFIKSRRGTENGS